MVTFGIVLIIMALFLVLVGVARLINAEDAAAANNRSVAKERAGDIFIILGGIVTVILAIFLIHPQSFVNKDYSKKSFDDYFDGYITWDMTKEDAMDYIESHQLYEREIKVSDSGSRYVLNDGFYSFIFKNNALTCIKLNMGTDTSMLYTLKDDYGKYDKKSTKLEMYYWYGMMDGEKTNMVFYPNQPGDCYLSFELAD